MTERVPSAQCVDGVVLREQANAAGGMIEGTECEFGFMCANPCRLSAPPKILGQPKIYRLERAVLDRAQKQLREVLPVDGF